MTLTFAVTSFPTCTCRTVEYDTSSSFNFYSAMENSSTYLFGKRFRNRLFVGGLPVNTTAHELANYFSNFGHVIETKIIFDENNVSKGYGFVTFASEKDVHNVTEMGTLFFRNKKLNLGPAVKKQGPMSPESPELVVVSTQMKGDYYYPVPSYTYSDGQLSPAPQYTYQHPCQVSYPLPQPGGYMYVYEEQPPLMFYQQQIPNVQNIPQAPCPPQKINKRLPPRMRRSREN